jgi:TrmH family RNA methyltransferase
LFDVTQLMRPDIAPLVQGLPESICVALPPKLLVGLSSIATPGVIFVVQPPVPVLPATIAESCLILDRVQDPGNVGTLLRTAAAAGLERVLLSSGCAAAWSPKVLRSAQGAHFVLQLHEQVDLIREGLGRLRVPLVVTALQNAVSLYEAELPARCAWVFGHEGQGVALELMRAAQLCIRIPHEANKVESLNVAAAAAICLFEHRRRFLASEVDQ